MGIDSRPEEHHGWADDVLARLDAPMGGLGVLFALLVLVDTVSRPTGAAGTAMTTASWALWGVFALEFAARAVAAPSRSTFLRRNWWQLIFLVLPFLRFLRFLRALRTLRRAARAGRVVSSMIRTTRGAGARLSGRLGWLVILTLCVIVGASQIVFELGGVTPYSEALYLVAMATIAGESMQQDGWLKILDVVFATYSVVVLAAVAGSFGSYLLERGSAVDGPRHVDLPEGP